MRVEVFSKDDSTYSDKKSSVSLLRVRACEVDRIDDEVNELITHRNIDRIIISDAQITTASQIDNIITMLETAKPNMVSQE